MAGARPGLTERVTGAAVEVAAPARKSIQAQLKEQTAQVELALPAHLKGNADAYVRSAITLIKQNPSLAKCDPLTILGGLMTASQLGLELGPLQVAYLVPRGNKAVFQIGYRGYIELGYRSGMLLDISAETICENDDFKFDRANGEISHTWDLRQDRGPAYAYYAVANLKGGGRAFVVLTKAEVEKYRKFSSMPNSPMWRDHYDSAAKKTCIRRLEPYLPKSTELSRAFVLDGSVASGVSASTLEIEPEEFEYAEVVEDEETPQNVDQDTGEIVVDSVLFGEGN